MHLLDPSKWPLPQSKPATLPDKRTFAPRRSYKQFLQQHSPWLTVDALLLALATVAPAALVPTALTNKINAAWLRPSRSSWLVGGSRTDVSKHVFFWLGLSIDLSMFSRGVEQAGWARPTTTLGRGRFVYSGG
ncbi:uncharacterized protein UV8b_00110 [Ustilaginoidea virens]|uniref:Uncharacterized protein n=1 Tax=Ustilaginoidea virens TaxID=1159556 RepID=A0A8E5HJ42_USTVR|nr:uncharacterized protein UV8b_00110 [Ustilaginoidea virens]QUC15869.1 hypothetical protein UV8b_00110 [Ustilaginoidea virens]